MVIKRTQIRLMTAADIPLGLRLGAQNGWNQLEADWLRFLAMQPDGCFLAERDGVGVGTAAACIFDSVAWVAMVLVDAKHRRQGIGTALMEHVLTFLNDRKIASIRLDATPLGRPIYERLGFVSEYDLVRYAGVLPKERKDASMNCTPVPPESLSELVIFDESITATNRGKFLQRYYQEYSDAFRMMRADGKLVGFLVARPGAQAVQIGPCIGDADAALALLADACRRHVGEWVYIDVPSSNSAVVAFAERMGLVVQRRLLRMGRGDRVVENLEMMFASSGPEKG